MINDSGSELVVLNDLMLVQDKINLFQDCDIIVNELIRVCKLADTIEYEFTNKDDSEVVF